MVRCNNSFNLTQDLRVCGLADVGLLTLECARVPRLVGGKIREQSSRGLRLLSAGTGAEKTSESCNRGARCRYMVDSSPGRPSVLNRLSWLSDAAQEDPDPHALVAQAESGALALLDLSANRRFAVLDAAARSRLIDRITSATSSGTIRTVLLNDLQLDNSNAPAVASLLRSSSTGSLRAVALERNLLSEEGLLLLSEALRGSALTEVSLANQRAAISTAAVLQLLDAMEATPSLVKLGLGALRDDGVRKRHEQVTMANTEAARRRRRQAAAAGEGGQEVARASELLRASSSSSSLDLLRARGTGTGAEAGGGGGAGGGSGLGEAAVRMEGVCAAIEPPARPPAARPPPPGKRQLSQDLLSRAACIEGTVSKAVRRQSAESIAFDWAAEAQRIRTSTPPEYGRPEAAEAAEAAGGSAGGGAAAQAAQAASAAHADSLYVLTGSSHWQTATVRERREVVLAFGSNRSLREVPGLCLACAWAWAWACAWRSMCMA